MNKKIAFFSSLAFIALPFFVMAQPKEIQGTSIATVVGGLVNLALNILWMVAAAYVVVMFVLAGFKFLRAQGDAGEIAEARQAVIWGVVGVAVIVLAWSIIAFVRNQLGS